MEPVSCWRPPLSPRQRVNALCTWPQVSNPRASAASGPQASGSPTPIGSQLFSRFTRFRDFSPALSAASFPVKMEMGSPDGL